MKLKKSSIEAAAAESKTAVGGGAFISARLRNPADEIAAQAGSGNDKLGGICALVATVLLVAVTALLYFNWDAIKSA